MTLNTESFYISDHVKKYEVIYYDSINENVIGVKMTETKECSIL